MQAHQKTTTPTPSAPPSPPAPAFPLQADIAAGVVVCLVALPLCLGIALASGAPLVSGLITGVIGGVLVSFFGRTPLLVSGPAAGLAAILVAGIAELGSFQALLAATFIAGLLQVAMALGRAGRLATMVPSSVVTGMLAAIGVLLILQQFPYAVGAPKQSAHGLEMLLVPFQALPQAALGPALAAAATLAVLIGWEYGPAALRSRVPGALVAVVVGTLAATGLGYVPGFAFDASHLVDLPAMNEGFGAVFASPDWSALSSFPTWKVAVTLAIVATLESLLSLEATDRLDPLKRRSDANRELLAQGAGNTLAGLVGGLPMTGVIVRSSANVAAGGRTWRASFTHGVLLATAVLALPWLLERIPLAALAAILLHTGWRLAHPSRFLSARAIGWGYLTPLIVTVVGVVATDLLIGVALGLAASALSAIVTNARHGVDVVTSSVNGNPDVRVQLAEAITFVHKPHLHRVLDGAPRGASVTVDASRARDVDHDVVELLHRYADTARDRGVQYRLVGLDAPASTLSH